MKVYWRMFLLLAALIGLFVGGAVIIRYWQLTSFAWVQENRGREIHQHLDTLLDLEGRSLATFAYQYADRDDTVAFVEHPDPAWAQRNIEVALATYEAQAAWVYRPDFTRVYSKTTVGGDALAELPLLPEARRFLFTGSRLAHCFVNTSAGILEISGASVHSPADVDRTTAPRGYFFVGRLWDAPFLAELSRLVGSPVEVLMSSDADMYPERISTKEGFLVLHRPLKGWDGNTVGFVRVEIFSTLVQQFVRASQWRFALATMLVLGLMFAFSWALMRWVARPLRLVFTSLNTGVAAPIRDLLKDETEFGQIARLIVQSLTQQEDLLKEIAERKDMEAVLRKERDQAQQYLDVTGVLISALNATGEILLINKRGCDLLGYAEAELIGRNWFEVCVPKAARPEVVRVFQQLMSGGVDQAAYYENPVVTKGGELRTLAFHNTVMRDSTGQISGVLSSGEDITERTRTEGALKASEYRYRSLLESANDAIFIADASTGMLVDANRKASELAGYSLEEIRGMHLSGLHPPEERSRAQALFRELVFKGAGRTDELHVLSKDGRHIPVGISTNTVDIEGRRLTLGIFRDMAERKRYEEALRKSEERFRKYFELPLIGIAITGPDMRWIAVNDKLCSILGYPREELGRVTWADLTLKEDLPAELALYQEVLDGQRDGITVEKRYVRKDGSLVHVHLSTQCIRKPDGSVDYSVAVVQDISERKHAEEERSRLEEQLRQAQKIESIGRLAGGVAHDFNNLLTPIIGYAEIALMNMEEGHPARADLQEILSAASRAKELTQQLLAFSRKQLLETKVIHLNTVLIEFQKMLRRLIGEDIEIVSRLDPALGPIKADPSQIQQIIINLAVNARDAMPQGGRLVIETKNVFLDEEYAKARLGVEPGPYVMVAVSDTGHGMDADVKRHLFEPFFTTKEPGKGTGLGLATVYGIVKQHGGAVWVYSEPGRGTTFRIYLRRVEEAAPGVERALKPHEERGTETVLVVEDSEMVRKLASDILAGLGYGILVAESPGTALRVAAEHAGPIELLLTDVVMPEMNGRELYERLVSTHPDLKVLYMSGYTGDVVAYQGILDTGIQFIQKPFSVHELARKVRETLDA